MPNKLITALKENKNDIRKKVIIVAGITVAAVAAGIVLTKLNADTKEVILLTTTDAAESLADSIPSE